MKLKPKMLLSIGVPLLIVFVIMGVVIYQMASAGLRLATETSMQSMARQYATLVTGGGAADRRLELDGRFAG